MKKIFGLVALSSIMLMALPAYTEADIIGENSGEITINGTLGIDNTDEDAPIVEGDDAWINVTLPTETIFYSASPNAGAPITSPEYTITNNSGRPVDISFKEIAKIGTSKGAKYAVSLQGFGKGNPKIINAGEVTAAPGSPTLIHTLASVDGKLGEDDIPPLTANTVTFRYVGEVTDAVTSTITESYTMTLEFKAVDWSEETETP
ncbi:hypothetical protein [Enterococcus sp. AD013-P3]|uniref:hypothetical protein n=1 Tax=Enterococcus sp. AD013-P3 TaxID=3411036 RepID=UPI003B945E00